MTKESADGGSDLDTQVLVGVESAAFTVDITEHGGADGDGKDIVGIGEEAYTGDETGANVVPASDRITSTSIEQDKL